MPDNLVSYTVMTVTLAVSKDQGHCAVDGGIFLVRQSDKQDWASLGKVKPSVQGQVLERAASHLLNQPTLYSLMKLDHKRNTRGWFLENPQDHGSCQGEKK